MTKLYKIRTMMICMLVIFSMSQYAYTQFQPDKSLSEVDASFIGEASGDESGWIQPAGDVNGDGFDDILITSWKNDEGGTDAGQVYLLLGSEILGWGMDFDLSQADASFIGEAADDRAGVNGRTVGDVNGDGFDDITIGAHKNAEGGIEAGQVYLLLGSEILEWGMDFNLSQADASFIGEAAGDRLSTCTPAGDVNGDGLDDFLIAALGNDEGGTDAGQVYLFLGRTAADWGMDFDLSQADASFIGESSGDQAGLNDGAITAGDVNGDGLDDFLITACFNDEGDTDAGQVYLILGSDTLGWGMDFNLSKADASFLGETAYDYAFQVASSGDVNGDGLDDFLIGAGWNDEGGSDAGQCYLILGRSAADWGMDFDLSQADASFISENPENHMSWVSYAGDVNGDGMIDLLLGTNNATEIGESYLILGDGAANWGMDYHLSSRDISFIGEDAADMAGWPVASAGDVNGDGLNDILIGAGLNDEGGTDAGQGYLVLGDSTTIVNIEDIREPITRIYPNPIDNILNIEISNTGKQGLEIEILTIAGQVIYQNEYKNNNTHFVEQIDLSGYAKGIYLVKVRQADTVYVGKVVVR